MRSVLLVDGQVFQTSAWVRGMGKYSLALLREVHAQWPGELHLVLSGELPHGDGLRGELARALPGVATSLLDLAPSRLTGSAEANRAVLDAHVRLLQGSADVTFLSLDVLLGETTAVLPTRVPTALVVYDLIPLLRPDLYLRRPEAAAVYCSRLGELLRADRLLTISRTVAGDLERELGVDPARITCIDGGPIDHASTPAGLPSGVREPFVLLPTASDARKNNRRAVMGFARFNADRHHQLVVTSALPRDQAEALARLSPDVVLTGRVSGPELEALYAHAAVVLQPSEAEGLGLPLLEAVQRGTRVACSDLPVFREVSATAFEVFDPTSVVQIADALSRAVADPQVDEAEYARVLGSWSWERTAAAVVGAVSTPAATVPERPRVLVVGPRGNPVLQRAHGALAGRVAYLLTGPADGFDHLSHHAPLATLQDVRSTAPGASAVGADVPELVVHLDDQPGSAVPLLVALSIPATVVLHAASLDVAAAAMVEQGLVSPARLALEDVLVSVRRRAQRVVTPDAYLEELRSPIRSPMSR